MEKRGGDVCEEVGIESRIVGCGDDGEVGAEVARVTKYCGSCQYDRTIAEIAKRSYSQTMA